MPSSRKPISSAAAGPSIPRNPPSLRGPSRSSCSVPAESRSRRWARNSVPSESRSAVSPGRRRVGRRRHSRLERLAVAQDDELVVGQPLHLGRKLARGGDRHPQRPARLPGPGQLDRRECDRLGAARSGQDATPGVEHLDGVHIAPDGGRREGCQLRAVPTARETGPELRLHGQGAGLSVRGGHLLFVDGERSLDPCGKARIGLPAPRVLADDREHAEQRQRRNEDDHDEEQRQAPSEAHGRDSVSLPLPRGGNRRCSGDIRPLGL